MYFFFSYARADEDGAALILQFSDDLRKEVRAQVGVGDASTIGFVDQEAIQVGDAWSDRLVQALQTYPVLVALYSPSYFHSEYCGKEFDVFRARQRAHAQRFGGGEPPVILPVIWRPCDRFMPPHIGGLQYHDRSLLDAGGSQAYKEDGLYILKNLTKYSDEYKTFVTRFAERVVRAAEHKLAPLDAPPDLHAAGNAFVSTGAPSTPGSEGPGSVRFVYVAATRTELEAARITTAPAAYGTTAGWQWVPFPPREPQNRIGVLAGGVANSKGLVSDWFDLGDDLLQRLEAAKESNSLVVLLVDARTLKIDVYRRRMERYDACNYLNCAAVVIWDGEPASGDERPELERVVEQVFDDNYLTGRYPRLFRDDVMSVEAFRDKVAEMLETLHLNVLSKGVPKRPVAQGHNAPVPTI